MAREDGHTGQIAGSFPLDDYVGAPFEDGGRGPVSYDCWGLVRAVYFQELGLDLPSYGDISAHNLRRVADAMGTAKDGEEWIEVETPEPFDVVVMRLHTKNWPGHVGVVSDCGRMLHVESRTDAVVVPLSHVTVCDRILGFRRHISQV
mgnify:FL=1